MKTHHTNRRGRPGGWQQAAQPDASGAAEWFAGRLPEAWFDGDPTVIVDREEITVIGKLAFDKKGDLTAATYVWYVFKDGNYAEMK